MTHRNMRRKLTRQRGVAVITALLLTTLAITIVASLFWQQQVQVRSIENQRLQLQKQWILRGALDWTRLILREDARYSQLDHLGEPWAVSLAETRLDQYVENARSENDVPDAAISGSIVDAQSRFNLKNLSANGTVDPGEVAAFARLLTNVQINPALAQAAANTIAATQVKPVQPSSTPRSSAAAAAVTTEGSNQTALDFAYVDDLLAVPGFTPDMLVKLKDFLVVLPDRTPVNVNTAPAEVLAARIDTLSLSDAAVLVAAREKAWFKDSGDLSQRLGRPLPQTQQIAFKTNYFLVNGNVRLNRAALEMQALIKRGDPGGNPTTQVVWIREH
ncbi:MAG: ral secretion pathway protein GspK [Burkholderia sp.]|jgi:general secretion pathway protein K|nr:ral secretion pathway protein GspK [Burkholderia sp.]